MLNLGQVQFAAEECERQGVGPMEVFQMCQAMNLAGHQHFLTVQFVKDLGFLVEPKKNQNGWRRVGVFFTSFVHHSMKEAATPDQIQRLIENLVMALHDGRVDAGEFYKEFELIHPFLDGNGRVGVILFNFINGTVDVPKPAPDFFGAEGTLSEDRV